jgi:hypothetical protein
MSSDELDGRRGARSSKPAPAELADRELDERHFTAISRLLPADRGLEGVSAPAPASTALSGS